MSESVGGLKEALGSDVVEVHDAREIEGCMVTVTLRPSDDDELARALAALTSHELPALVRGGGTRMTLGNAPRGARVVLSTERLLGISEFDSGLIVTRSASTPSSSEIERWVKNCCCTPGARKPVETAPRMAKLDENS